MKKTFRTILAGALALLTVSCYDDSALREQINELDSQLKEILSTLEGSVESINNLSDAVAAIKVETANGVTTLSLSDGSSIVLSATGALSIVSENGVNYWATADGTPLGVKVGDYLAVDIDAETGELLISRDGSNFAGSGVVVAEGSAYVVGSVTLNADGTVATVKVGDATYDIPVVSSLGLARTDFFLRYEGTKNVALTAEGLTEYYVMNEPDGWKVKIEDATLMVTAPTKKAVEIGAAEVEGQILVHATSVEGKCIVGKIDVKAGPGLTLAVDIHGNMTLENSYYGESTNMWGDTSFGFSGFVLGLATPALFNEDPQAYVQVYNDTWSAPNWDILFPSAYNFAQKGIYEEGVYETDIVKTTVADAYFAVSNDALPAGANYVVWAAPVDGEGKAIIEDMVYTEYVNITWNVAVKEVTHSDITLTAEVAGASKFVISAVAESSYNSEYNPMSFDDYMNASFGGPWSAFTSWAAVEALGMVFDAGKVPAEFKLSELLGQKLAFGENYKIWVMPVFDHLTKLDEANSYPDEGYYAYDYSAFDYKKHFLPFVIDAKTNDIVAGGEYAATLEESSCTFSEIHVDVTLAEGTESCYYAWYTPEDYSELKTDAEVMASLFETCFTPLTENGQASKTYVGPGEEYVLATVSIGTDGKYGEIVTANYSTLAIPYDENIKVEVVSAVLDDDGRNYTVTVNVTGATKVMGYNITVNDNNNKQFPVNVCKNGHKASFYGYQIVDVVDGQATLTFTKSTYKKDYYVAAYNVEGGVVSAISAEFVVKHLFD